MRRVDEGVYVKVAKCNFGAGRAAVKRGIWVGKDGKRVAEEVIKKVVLQVRSCQGLAIAVLDSDLPSAGCLRPKLG
jgi:hypothetical protein